jgi:L-ascorbate metabolism protein UlaG (beta-lactamase superfamily)
MLAKEKNIFFLCYIFLLLFLILPICHNFIWADNGDSNCSGVKITLICNEGFLIEYKDKKVVIDGLLNYKIPEDVLNLMVKALSPFENIDLILTTHYHADHFSPQIVAGHLKNNPKAKFISTEQTIKALKLSDPQFDIKGGRIEIVIPHEGKRVQRVFDGLKVEIMSIHHGRNRPIQNLGFLLHWNDLKILHLGDSEMTLTDFKILNLPGEKIDIAFIPYWYFTSNSLKFKAVIKEAIGAKKVIPMHLDLTDGGVHKDSILRDIKNRFTNVVIFENKMETKIIK